MIFDPLAGGTNQAQISLDAGVTISNNITLNTVRSLSGGNGALTDQRRRERDLRRRHYDQRQ